MAIDRASKSTPDAKKVLSFNDLIAHLRELGTKLKIDFLKNQLFETTLLGLGNVTEIPKGCEGGCDPAKGDDGDTCLLYYAISREAINQLFSTLGIRFPTLEIIDVTNRFTESPDESVPLEMNGHKTIIIQMNVSDIAKYILPALEIYLNNHPEIIQANRRFLYKELDFLGIIGNIFMPIGICPAEAMSSQKYIRCYEDVITDIINQAPLRASATTLSLIQYLQLTEIISIINDFSLVGDVKEVSSQPLAISSIKWDGIIDDPHLTCFNPMPVQPATTMQGFFNRLAPNSAKISEITAGKTNAKDAKSKLVTLSVDYQALMHEGLCSDIKDTLHAYPLDKLDNYRKQSGTMVFTTQEACVELTRIQKSMSDNSEYKSICQSITDLVDYVQKKGVDNKAELVLRHSNVLHLIDAKKSLCKGNTQKLFSTDSETSFDEVLSDLVPALETIRLCIDNYKPIDLVCPSPAKKS